MPEAEKFIKENVTLTPAQKTKAEMLTGKKFRKNTYTFWTGARNGDRLGYVVLLDVIGKERPITFMTAISPEGKTLGVELLVYRESQGSEVRSKWFMRQFVGKSVGAVLKLGRDIDAVSGATMSSRSTAYAVKKSLALVEAVYKSGKD
jgi:Na+-translocating ferredoxin:NAD+ oxidoreductase RnfG subunit